MTTRAERFAALLGESSAPTTNNATASKHKFCDVAPADQQFVPINAVSKFPYKYMKQSQGETVSKQFFTGGKFWERDWEL